MHCTKAALKNTRKTDSLAAGKYAEFFFRLAPPAALALLILLATCAWAGDFSGASALDATRHVVGFGPRPPGSAAIHKLQSYLVTQLKTHHCQVIEDAFIATTPEGPIAMKNIIARFPGHSGRAVAISGHYDTKRFSNFTFVGANDGGSSAGILLELARALDGESRIDDVYLVWFDGEEAFRDWSDTDSLYGSRHLAEKWSKDGTLARVKALINIDMTGDSDLGIMPEMNSSAALRKLVWQAAEEKGYGKYFLDEGGGTEDDHMPFIRAGANAVDLIDFNYGPGNSYWHTAKDTINRLSAHSMQVVGSVVLEVLHRLE